MGNDDVKSDVFVFDTDKEIIKKVAKGGIFNFTTKSNASVAVQENKVVSLVTGRDDLKPHLIEFSMLSENLSAIDLPLDD